MTTVPQTLRDLGAFWTQQGGVNLGVVGDKRHCRGYHLGRDRIFGTCACKPQGQCVPGLGSNDYSVEEPRDLAGLSDAASALDLGRVDGKLAGLQAFSLWLITRCRANEPGTADIREIIYSPDGTQVERYSNIDKKIHTGPGNGDTSHRTHTHVSFYRDSEFRDKRPIFAPFFIAMPDTSTATEPAEEAVVKSFPVYERDARVTLRQGAVLFDNDALQGTPVEVVMARREVRYVGTLSDAVRIVANTNEPDANISTLARFVAKAGLVQDANAEVVVTFPPSGEPPTDPL